jgi:hypothetical protein
MTTIPQPAAPASSYTATYDAWNRLVKLVDGANTVQENQYDGLRRRTIRKSYTAGVLSETRHYYYTARWQIVEERLGTTPDSATANRRYVWGLRYIDDLILRDRDTTGGGTLNERLYGIQDPNWNMIALANTTGDIQERYAYSAYGMPSVLTPAFASRASSSFAWEHSFCAYYLDSGTALLAVRFRMLNPLVGWVTRDLIQESVIAGLYAYVNDQPLVHVDPLGLGSLLNPQGPTALAEAMSGKIGPAIVKTAAASARIGPAIVNSAATSSRVAAVTMRTLEAGAVVGTAAGVAEATAAFAMVMKTISPFFVAAIAFADMLHSLFGDKGIGGCPKDLRCSSLFGYPPCEPPSSPWELMVDYLHSSASSRLINATFYLHKCIVVKSGHNVDACEPHGGFLIHCELVKVAPNQPIVAIPKQIQVSAICCKCCQEWFPGVHCFGPHMATSNPVNQWELIDLWTSGS